MGLAYHAISYKDNSAFKEVINQPVNVLQIFITLHHYWSISDSYYCTCSKNIAVSGRHLGKAITVALLHPYSKEVLKNGTVAQHPPLIHTS